MTSHHIPLEHIAITGLDNLVAIRHHEAVCWIAGELEGLLDQQPYLQAGCCPEAVRSV
jgi:hypothetical protein